MCDMLRIIVGSVACLFSLFFVSCTCGRNEEKTKTVQLVSFWKGKEIIFPSLSFFTIQGKDTATYSYANATYKVLSYVDSVGCMSCKLHLSFWKSYVAQMDSMFETDVSFLFFMHPKRLKDLRLLLERERFVYPVCVDMKDSLNKLNHFPSDISYQTFLLDKDNKVLAIGNPVLNPKVKDLYLRIIRGESPQAPSDAGTPVTTVSVSSAEADLGTFPWQEPRTCTFTLRNTGDRPLVIHDVTTSCGCLTVDYPEEPARPGEELTLRAHYRADSRGTVLKSMQVYCNAQGSPLRLRVTGTAE